MTRTRALALCILTALLLLPAAARASASKVVVSQVYGAGGNAGATLTNDFVELFNGSDAAVDLSTWTIQYATATGTTWQATPLSGTIAPGGYYLVQLASNGTVGAALPSPDATGTTNLSGANGKVALVRDAAALTCGASAGTCSADPLVEDLVGYGAASDFEGSGSAPALSSTAAALRAGGGCTDSDDNSADFTAGTPQPRNSASATLTCGTDSPPPPAPAGASGSASVGVDVTPTLAISLDQPALDFGSATFGETPAALAENVTVASNSGSGYSLGVQRTAFAPADLPLAISANAPAGGQLGAALAGGALVPIPVSPASALEVGTTAAASAGGGDLWATRIGFSSPLPLVASGRYAATVTFSVVAR